MGFLVLLVLAALAAFGAWKWSENHRSATILDRVDSLFTGSLAAVWIKLRCLATASRAFN